MPADTGRSVFLPALPEASARNLRAKLVMAGLPVSSATGIVKVNRVPRAQTRSATLGPDAAAVGFH